MCKAMTPAWTSSNNSVASVGCPSSVVVWLFLVNDLIIYTVNQRITHFKVWILFLKQYRASQERWGIRTVNRQREWEAFNNVFKGKWKHLSYHGFDCWNQFTTNRPCQLLVLLGSSNSTDTADQHRPTPSMLTPPHSRGPPRHPALRRIWDTFRFKSCDQTMKKKQWLYG